MMHVAEPLGPAEEPISELLAMDPESTRLSRGAMTPEEVSEAAAVLDAMRRWRAAERRMSEASRRHMELGETDMRAIRFVMAGMSAGRVVTPSDLAKHLGVSTASVTKILDRLAAKDHILRLPHPADRRSTAVEVTEETRRSARTLVGKTHAERFRVAAELTSQERRTIIGFLDDLCATEPRPQP
ncbi:MarR family winged helix-turn-helix transcriptional regulator [Nesterenkonia sp. NBAIMH1]|uniref:MarR family winged helix-turn-helix transcriptional regulator n=1 Tax=Nesterenkonia sp. NBAIMH1 TaxID=2600320 RepID=UPI0011B65E78|nr:MarR family transcriptional regulator [Nesterenkonia sp. NBAIMH1]